MLSFLCNAWFDEECKAHIKMFTLTNNKNENVLTFNQYKRMVRKKNSQYYQIKGIKKIKMFKPDKIYHGDKSREKRKM